MKIESPKQERETSSRESFLQPCLYAVSAGEGAVPALLWWKATPRTLGTVIYLEIGLGNSAAATARVTLLHSPRQALKMGLLSSSRSGCSLLYQWLTALLVCGKGSACTVHQ